MMVAFIDDHRDVYGVARSTSAIDFGNPARSDCGDSVGDLFERAQSGRIVESRKSLTSLKH